VGAAGDDAQTIFMDYRGTSLIRKHSHPSDPHKALDMVLLKSPRGMYLLVGEVPLYIQAFQSFASLQGDMFDFSEKCKNGSSQIPGMVHQKNTSSKTLLLVIS
jgi:hypothetical protein